MLLEVYAPFEEADVKTTHGRSAIAQTLAGIGGARANQIELAASQAALTPSKKMAIFVRKHFDGFLNVMVNAPGQGTNGAHTADQVGAMMHSIRALKNQADGFVIGVATPDGSLNVDAVTQLVTAAKGRELTYIFDLIAPEHRAHAIGVLGALGFTKLLTSGGHFDPVEGKIVEGRIDTHISALEDVQRAAADYGMGIVARGGIKAEHLEDPAIGPRLSRLGAIHARFDSPVSKKAFSPNTFDTARRLLLEKHDRLPDRRFPRRAPR